jgi:hypothetical protein
LIVTSLLDGPGPYASIEELRSWLEYLRSLELTDEVQRALATAERWLADHPDAAT